MLEKKVNFIVDWLRALTKKANARGLLVGVSGGVDSALAAFLIKKACPDHSLGVIMPCKSDQQDEEDAFHVVRAARLKHVHIDLTKTHGMLLDEIRQVTEAEKWSEDADKSRLVDANLRARLRMSTLYALAQHYQYLVVGTDNAAEWHLGYFTKYGDGGADCVPLANLTKGEVREWARYVGVPQEIIDKAPSAGLWEGQTDEEELGLSYDVVDRYLKGEAVPSREREMIERMHRQSEHKRTLPPKPPVF